jgi:hypothetical protein
MEIQLPQNHNTSTKTITTNPIRRIFCFFSVYFTSILLIIITINVAFSSSRNYATKLPSPPDYHQATSWMALPTTADDADVIPAECGENRQSTASIDTFYLHPTSFSSSTQNNGPIHDIQSQFLSDGGSLNQQASVYNGISKVYAPRYRQASQEIQDAFGTWNNNNGSDLFTPMQEAMDVAFNDVVAAFETFIETYNVDKKSKHNRPYIIASHSQGTMHGKRLIKYINTKSKTMHPIYMKAKKHLLFAYIIGNTIAANNEMPSWLPLCENATSLHCYVTWNTYVKGGNPDHWLVKLRNYKTTMNNTNNTATLACVNPLDWKLGSHTANKSLHYGSFGILGSLFLTNFNEHFVSARCTNEGIVEISPDPTIFPGWPYFKDITFKGNGELHAYDYNMFYRNIRYNVWERSEAAKARGIVSNVNNFQYIEPTTCKPCGQRPRCTLRIIFQIMVAGIVLWLLFAYSCVACDVGFLLLWKHFWWKVKRQSTSDDGNIYDSQKNWRYPTWLELILCASCCCCCQNCCTFNGKDFKICRK